MLRTPIRARNLLFFMVWSFLAKDDMHACFGIEWSFVHPPFLVSFASCVATPVLFFYLFGVGDCLLLSMDISVHRHTRTGLARAGLGRLLCVLMRDIEVLKWGRLIRWVACIDKR